MTVTTTIDLRIYYEDTDFSGLVYHANYLKYFERGRTEGLRAHGFSNSDMMNREDPLIFAVRKMDIEFHTPARMDDLLTITTTVEEVRGARMVFLQKALRGEELIASAYVLCACLTPDGRPRRLPKDILGAFGL